ncbi:MAG TPA: FAD-dependent monooxygenase [Candidatus Sulfomarinibacteraceae bacterium]|nr:FAD-dependent monooxygenase [Candidatus Sulfomarinibacteraceae bacterium]
MQQEHRTPQAGTENQTAIVLGGSVAGIWTARVLADHFARVIVVERDELPSAAEHRPGVSQGRQYHIMLRRGLQIMERLFPGIRDELKAAGGVHFDEIKEVKTRFRGQWLEQYESGSFLLGASRVLLESILRRRLRDYPRVEFMEGTEVIGLLGDETEGRVTGARVRRRRGPDRGTESTLHAALVIDATGRNSRAPEWLADLGYAAPRETIINPYLGYASRRYRKPQKMAGDWEMMGIMANPPEETRSGLILPEENNTWVVLLAGANKDYPPTDEEGFDAFARSLDRDFHRAISDAEPLTRIYGYRRTKNRWRHYEDLQPWPEGFAVVGDAFSAFNPIYGQGMTVSAMTAVALDEQLRKAGGVRTGFAARFQKQVARVTKPVWLLTTGADLAFPGTEGGSGKSVVDRLTYWYTDLVMDAVPYDDRVRRTFLDVNHLLLPATALFSPGILWRVLRHALQRQQSEKARKKETEAGRHETGKAVP